MFFHLLHNRLGAFGQLALLGGQLCFRSHTLGLSLQAFLHFDHSIDLFDVLTNPLFLRIVRPFTILCKQQREQCRKLFLDQLLFVNCLIDFSDEQRVPIQHLNELPELTGSILAID